MMIKEDLEELEKHQVCEYLDYILPRNIELFKDVFYFYVFGGIEYESL